MTHPDPREFASLLFLLEDEDDNTAIVAGDPSARERDDARWRAIRSFLKAGPRPKVPIL